ncbi:hypothetical protein A4G23_03492 [Streptomyces rubrolavendulae]|uniref:Uncharacterized protein n=1 Tax=Streptomyces rubrolavendulae TaxID=285473 RepID=A0A1D8G5A3_9ACTN|nr:hypothetical protein A4G23_03492 [Streptomyces rubrolavendulae]
MLGVRNSEPDRKGVTHVGIAERKASGERIREAEEARDALRAALSGVGVTLPSLGLDCVSLAADPPYPLVELGRCAPRTALRLAEAPTGAAGASGGAAGCGAR